MLEKLAKQTAVYGISTIVVRFLSYLLTPYYTRIFGQETYGVVTDIYALIPLALTLLTMGMESSYFRFSAKAEEAGGDVKAAKRRLFATTWGVTSLAAAVFFLAMAFFRDGIAHAMGEAYVSHPEYVVWVGLIGTYKMIVNSVSGYVNLIFNSVISSFGNLIATESREKQFQLFLVYRFFAIWVYGFSAVGFFLLLSPLVELYVGADRVLATSIIAWYLTDYFFKGERVVLSNFKTAAGVFEQDKYLSILQGIVNLVLSIALVFKIGLAGVFIGTVVSGLIANITKPIIIYRVCFEKSAVSYFQESIKYLLVIGAALAVLIPLQNLLMPQVTIAKFALMIVIITVVFNGIFLIVFGRTEEFKYLYGMVKGRWKRS